jgi:hypothetical protein
VKLEGLLGVDAIRFFKEFRLVQVNNKGSAFAYSGGIIPFGSVDSLLPKEAKFRANQPRLFKEKAGGCANSSIVNFVLNPLGDQFDPVHSIVQDSAVEGRLDRLFSVEALGLKEDEYSDYDAQQIAKFESSIENRNGEYFVDLPWIEDKVSAVRSNFTLAKVVLERVRKKLHSSGMFQAYNEVFLQQLREGILEEIDLNAIDPSQHVWIPHRAVIRTGDQVTTKVRPVLNCSLKVDQTPSLNESAYPGVNLLTKLADLLLKVRLDDYLVMSDIRKAFLMIKLKQEIDRNRFSILWVDESGKLKAYRYSSLVFGFISSPFILNYVIKHHVKQYPQDEVSSILDSNFYVDNLFFTGNDLSKLTYLYKESLARMAEGGFHLRSWASNNPELCEVFRREGVGADHQATAEKLLGYNYFPKSDAIAVAGASFNDNPQFSKRIILSEISKIFDPLGLCSPVTVRGKLLMKRIWTSKVGWDEPLPEEIIADWLQLKHDLQTLSEVQFDRKVARKDEEVSLILFTDASKQFYGFNAYVVSESETEPRAKLAFAKVKNAPFKSKSLPTLELMAVLLCLKCLDTLLAAFSDLKIKNVTIGVDAQIVLSWVTSGKVKTKNLFARNRVNDVLSVLRSLKSAKGLECKFKYVPTGMNPSDMLTRGLTLKEWTSNLNFWKFGPSFLNSKPLLWPDAELGCLSSQSKILTNIGKANCKESLFPLNRFSSFNKLVSVTALVLTFVRKLRKLPCDGVDARIQARQYWLKFEQENHFFDVLTFLQSPQKEPPLLVKNLNLFIDSDSIIRSRGRLDKCVSLSYDVKNPILLPRESFLALLIVRDFHERIKHLGVSSTLNAIRNAGFWIPKGRATVKSIISKCILCKKLNSLSFKYPKVTDFVADRVNFTKPFQHTGVDYTGHIYVKYGDKVVKMYILIFTCLNVRAIHLELLPSLSTSDFLMAFVRFTNLHCIPNNLYSDNASTFLQAGELLDGSSIDNEFNQFLYKHCIKHIKIPLYSAWVGAAWERLIRVVKSCFYKTVGRRKLEYFQVLTLLSDVTNSVNSRPLTYVDSEDAGFHALTPNSFLKLETGRSLVLPPGDASLGSDRSVLVASLEGREELFDAFKEQWYSEYILSLREADRDRFEASWSDTIKVGDVVLISAPGKSRPFWSMGRVVELLTGRDQKTRCVKVMKPDRSVDVFSINLLYPLELSADVIPSASGTERSPARAPAASNERPKRAAAVECCRKLKLCN